MPDWKFVLGGSARQHMRRIPIANHGHWMQYVEEIGKLHHDKREEVLDAFNEIADQVDESYFAEEIMKKAIDKLYFKNSPMRAGIEEYDEIMASVEAFDGK